MSHTYASLLTHVIFSTKDRLPQLRDELRPRLFAYMGGIVRELECAAIIVNGPVDHVYVLLKSPPAKALADIVRVLKTNSSRWVHEEFPAASDFAWQQGYGAFSVSESASDDVRKYIEGQEAHHRQVSFQDEFVAFLKKHQIQYDPRYIWE